MLSQKQKEVPYISIFKTQSGEEFIGKVVEETMLAYMVKNALCLVPAQDGLRFAPFMMMADSEKVISVPKPIITAAPTGKLEEQYEQALSPIVLPKKA